MSTLHLGTFQPDALRELLPTALSLANPGTRFQHGDSWEEWGEGRTNLLEPEHVILQRADSTDLMLDIVHVLRESPSLLQPMTMHFQRGVLAVISDDEDWEVQYYVLTDQPSLRFLANDLARTRNGAWENDAWRAFRNLGPLTGGV